MVDPTNLNPTSTQPSWLHLPGLHPCRGQDPESGRTFYANVATGESSWEPPVAAEAAPPPVPGPPPDAAAGRWSVDFT